MCLGIIGLNWFVRSIYKLLSVCLLSFDFVWAVVIVFVVGTKIAAIAVFL